MTAMGNKSEDYEMEDNGKGYKDDDEEQTIRPSLEEAYASNSDSSDEEDVDEFDPLNYDAGTLKRKKRRKGKSNLQIDTDARPQRKKSWIRQRLVPSKFCCGMIVLFFVTVALLLSAGGIWAIRQSPSNGESPAWYPSPQGGTDPAWAEAYEKAAVMVRKMDVIEKVNVTTGTGWMMGMCVGNTGPAINAGFPSLCLQDGPLGIRWADNITAFPAGITVGATWNKELMYQRGAAHGLEARKKGINVILGPAMGPLGRTPLGGRNWEGFGADPVLQGIAAAQTIKGIQSQGVIATAKHFVGNEQEHFRQSWEWGTPNAISSNIDDRTLHEIYAWPFAESIRAGVGSIMCSYNQVNNSYACQNSKLMNGILKDEMGFQGFIQSDWLAQRSGVASALAGLDMSMPGDGLRWQDGDSLWGGHLTRAIYNGSVPIERLNDMALRTVAAWYQMGQDDKALFPDDGPNFSSWTNDQVGLLHPGSDDKNAIEVVNKFVAVDEDGSHGKLARQIAAEGIVLLKNEDALLPLRRQGGLRGAKQDQNDAIFHVGVIGEDASENPDGMNSCDDRGCNKGTLASGWGSGAVDFPYLVTPLDAITKGYHSGVHVDSFNGTNFDSEAERVARHSNLCLVFANADAGEGYMKTEDVKSDRPNLKLQNNGENLIKRTAETCGNGTAPTIVILHAVGAILVESFVDHPAIKSIVLANLPGQESGNALVDVLFGDVNPSGKLPYTMGKSLEDYGPAAKILSKWSIDNLNPQQNFSEGSLIDYRHFDFYDIEPRYAFGFGMSYTTFSLTNPSIKVLKPEELTKATPAPRPAGLAPPTLPIRLPDVRTALFPAKFRKLRKYIYPYLEDTKDLSPQGNSPPYPPWYEITSTPSQAGGGPGGNPDLFTPLLEIRVTVTNTGPRNGAQVVQVYVELPQDYTDPETGEVFKQTPKRVLRAFEKVTVAANGATEEVVLQLTRKDLSLWSVVRQNWVLPQGVVERMVKVGTSSRDLPVELKY